jgi:hypothetical protein
MAMITLDEENFEDSVSADGIGMVPSAQGVVDYLSKYAKKKA